MVAQNQVDPAPLTVVAARERLCRVCPTPCEPARAGLLDLTDVASCCPIGRWSALVPPADPPSLPVQAVSFVAAAAREARERLAGSGPMSDEEIRKRELVCRACVHFGEDRCRKCGCPFGRKLPWRSATCPIGRWHQSHHV